MFTSLDKAIVALVMSGLFLLNNFGLVPWTPTPELEMTISTIIAALTPVFVWLFPNKPTA